MEIQHIYFLNVMALIRITTILSKIQSLATLIFQSNDKFSEKNKYAEFQTNKIKIIAKTILID